MSNGGTLPQDLLTDILSRLPVKSLCQFKCVTPSWNSLISDPLFAKTHLQRAKTQNPKYLDRNIVLVSGTHKLNFVDFADVIPTAKKLNFPAMEQHAVRNWAGNSCNGMLLVTCQANSNFLLNPSTRECKKLPTPSFVLDLLHDIYWYVCGVVYDASTDDFKVLMLCYYHTDAESATDEVDEKIVAIYSLKTDAWRRIQDFHFNHVDTTCGVFFNGCLHCRCWRSGSFGIVAFNLSDETWREVLPPSLDDCGAVLYYRLAVLGDCLCLVLRHLRNQVEVWMMKEYGVRESWIRYAIDMNETSTLQLLCLLAEDEFLLKPNGVILDKSYREKLVVCNPDKETVKDLVVRGIPPVYTFWGTYVESLISPHHGGGIG